MIPQNGSASPFSIFLYYPEHISMYQLVLHLFTVTSVANYDLGTAATLFLLETTLLSSSYMCHSENIC